MESKYTDLLGEMTKVLLEQCVQLVVLVHVSSTVGHIAGNQRTAKERLAWLEDSVFSTSGT